MISVSMKVSTQLPHIQECVDDFPWRTTEAIPETGNKHGRSLQCDDLFMAIININHVHLSVCVN